MKIVIDYNGQTREYIDKLKNKFLQENVGITLKEANKERFYYKKEVLVTPKLSLSQRFNTETEQVTVSLKSVEVEENCVFILFQHQFIEENFGDLGYDKSILHGIFNDIDLALEATKSIKEDVFEAQFGSGDCSWYIEIVPINTKLE